MDCEDFPIRHCTICGKTPVVARELCRGHYHKLCRYGKADLANRKEHDGRSSHPLYHTWKGIKGRCNYPGHKEYEQYGGRGISVCERWNNANDGFWNFVKDVGEKPGPKYSLDRIDPDGDYCPENCRWATKLEQMNNTQLARKVIEEAQERGFVATYRVKIDTDVGSRSFAFERLSDLYDFINKLKKG